ncbi:hypothetical protein BT63DRAFT_240904 [Microthyrium microscopicum]|uniref:Uncharacterized protein n=1 Tax=Microthyrium microscopicum TaxID=703497 RepID=A0A6A6UEE8_9PEZI|nr:hypothetical protein BT63DRAFT_240904 [Microthyrium microscopicum]
MPRFAVSDMRFSGFAFERGLIILIALVIIMQSLVLSGSSSSLESDHLYIVGLSNVEQKTVSKVSVGYFGLCIRSGQSVDCKKDLKSLALSVGSGLSQTSMLKYADAYRSDVLFSGFLVGSIALSLICAILLATFPGWHEDEDEITGSIIDVKPFPSRPVVQVAHVCIIASEMFAFIAALWQHVSAATFIALINATDSIAKPHIGKIAVSFVWLSFGLLCLCHLGIWSIQVSMSVLDRLVSDGGSESEGEIAI